MGQLNSNVKMVEKKKRKHERNDWKVAKHKQLKYIQGARDEQRVLKDVAARQEKELERWEMIVQKKLW